MYWLPSRLIRISYRSTSRKVASLFQLGLMKMPWRLCVCHLWARRYSRRPLQHGNFGWDHIENFHFHVSNMDLNECLEMHVITKEATSWRHAIYLLKFQYKSWKSYYSCHTKLWKNQKPKKNRSNKEMNSL